MRISDWSSDVCSSDLEDDERQRTDDIGGRFGFRRHGLDLEPHLGALSEHVRKIGEGFGQVAARLALNGKRDDEELELGRAEAVGGFLKRLLHGAADADAVCDRAELGADRSEEHTSELQSLMRISYAVFCLKKKK